MAIATTKEVSGWRGTRDFYLRCGTSNIIRIDCDDLPPDMDSPREKYFFLCNGHHIIVDFMAHQGRPLKALPFAAAVYVKDTGENWSGPSLKGLGVRARVSRLSRRRRFIWYPVDGELKSALCSTMHANSELLFQAYAVPYIAPESRVLEIGPDRFPSTYQKIMPHATRAWDTVDIYDSKNLTYPNAGEYAFPIPDDTYDVVISGQVIEHVKKIWCWIKEVERVCKKGGHVMIINPVSWPYHTHPVDCWRIFPDGMRALLEDHGCE
jgi:methyltransferase family protein